MRTTCRGCESTDLDEILDLGRVPLAGGFLADPAAPDRLFPLKIHACRRCALVQILDAIDPDVLFQDYSFSSSTIGPLVDHFSNYSLWMHERFHPDVVVEFGCNDGVLLAPLKAAGVRAVGVDISENIGNLARSKGLDVLTGAFDDSMAARIVDRAGCADVVTGSNAFAHNDHPELILSAARRVLRPDGHLCLEMMYAGDLFEQWQWDTLYHEHLTFYGLGSLSKLLERYGFFVVDAERIPMHGGSLRVTAALAPLTEAPATVRRLLDYEEKLGLNRWETWSGFGALVGRKIGIVRDVFATLSVNASAYGAAGRQRWVNARRRRPGVQDSRRVRASLCRGLVP